MRIAILGQGIIGSAWAANLRADGDDVRVWNRTPRPELPGWRADPAAAAREADLVIVVVADPPAVAAVLAAAAPALAPGAVVVQASTIDAEATRGFAATVRTQGAAYLDAPFTGSKPAAEARQTVFYVGGAEVDLARARPALDRLAKAVLHVGEVGAASSLKLAMNINIALVCEALAESRAFARAAGIGDDTYFRALALNASRSGIADLKEPKLRACEWSPQFALKHMAKDLRLALADPAAGNLPQLHALQALYDRGMAAGWGDRDFAVLAELVGRG